MVLGSSSEPAGLYEPWPWAEEEDDRMQVDLSSLDDQPAASTSYEPFTGPIPAVQARSRAAKSHAEQRSAIREVKARMQLYQQGLDLDETPDDVWLESLKDILLPAEEYVAGYTQKNTAAWSEWLDDRSEQARAVVKAITEGLHFDFVSPQADSQQQRQGSAARMQQVRQMLVRTVGAEQAEVLLSGSAPGAVHMPNKASVDQYSDFVRAEACRLRQAGALRTPEELGMQNMPILIHGLAVVENRHGKLRLIVDARYLNLFLRYIAFKYETLQHAVSLLQQGDWLYTTDFKSGYHQIPLHLDCYQYMGVEIEGTVYVLPFLAFGIAPACRQFTEIMQQTYAPLKEAGQGLSSFIDDSLGARQPVATAKYQAETMCRLQSALGFFGNPSGPKGLLPPQQRGRYLGMEIDTVSTVCLVPKDKLDYMLDSVRAALQSGQASPKQLASLAGLLLSFRPAIRLAPMFTRGLYCALRGLPASSVSSQLRQITMQDLRWWAEHAVEANGRCWWDRASSFTIASDASESCYAAYAVSRQQIAGTAGMQPAHAAISHGSGSSAVELLSTESGQPWQMQHAFSVQEQARMQRPSAFSSALREVRTVRLALQAMSTDSHTRRLMDSSMLHLGLKRKCLNPRNFCWPWRKRSSFESA